MSGRDSAEIAVIGGTGVYDPEIIEEAREVKVYTPFGAPSDLVTLGTYEGRKVAFIPRHGRGHQIPPHRINYRANIWALKELGVKQIVASSACGSLRKDYEPGDFVITDQFIDRTRGRPDTFYEGGQICHISSADPICPRLHDFFVNHARKLELKVHPTGTYVSAAMVTDYDVWAERPVSTQEVIETMHKNSANFKRLIMEALPEIPEERACGCGEALKTALL